MAKTPNPNEEIAKVLDLVDLNKAEDGELFKTAGMPRTDMIAVLDNGLIQKYADNFTPKAELFKSVGIPPDMQPFTRLSTMPDQTMSGLLQWPGALPGTLKKLAHDHLAPQMIIFQRVADVLQYSKLSSHVWKPGWRVETKIAGKPPSNADMKTIREAETFLLNCNIEITNPRERDAHKLTSFSKFLASLVRNSLTYDGMAIWTDMAQNGKIKAFAALDASVIRLVNPEAGYKGDKRIFAVAINEALQVVKTFTRDELIWSVRNPRVDPDSNGYGLPEIEVGGKLIQAYSNAFELNMDAFNKNCHSADTEVLTKSGWKLFSDVDISTDEFATLNLKTDALEYQKATDSVWDNYEGDMYALKSRSLDFLVTPNHRIITKYRPTISSGGESPYEITQAAELYEQYQKMDRFSRNNYVLPAQSIWEGEEIEAKTFNFMHKNDSTRTISGDDYCAFMGMYLSEGSTAKVHNEDKCAVRITQLQESKGFGPYKDLLTRILGHTPNYQASTHQFGFTWAEFVQYILQYGKDCYDKSIPAEILNATPRQQKIFFDYYVLGDGCVRNTSKPDANVATIRTHIATTSKRMADGFQELIQKMGLSATIHTVNPNEKPLGKIKGKQIKTAQIRYDILVKTSPYQSMNMEKLHYKGKIGCVTVPNGTLYVRRNGKAIWSGNSIPQAILKLKGAFNQKQLDFWNRIWTNIKKGAAKNWTLPVVRIPTDGDIDILDLTRMKGNEVYYKEFINMLMGAYCAVYRFPVHRFGYKTSGMQKDEEQEALPEWIDEQDLGKIELLNHIENLINEYFIWANWPHLQFTFTGKSPKEDSREFQNRSLSMTIDERRASSDLPPLHELIDQMDIDAEEKEKDMLKSIARLIGLAPTDPGLSGVFQSIVSAMIKSGADVGVETPGAQFPGQTDPAKVKEHGHVGGLRRNSRAERGNAKAAKKKSEI